MSSPEPGTPLNYAPPVSFFERHQRLIIGASAGAVLLLALWLGAPPILRKAQQLYQQHYCLAFRSPPLAALDAEWHWSAFSSTFEPMSGGAVLYMGKRTRPDGQTRLVVVEAPGFISSRLSLYTHSVTPGTMWGDPNDVSGYVHWPPELIRLGYRTTFGEPDSANSQHFWFKFINRNGNVAFVDGWLDDRDQITLELRAFPAANTTQP